ncbi:DUF6475 domain-containing protein [Acidovorax sp. Root219]|uniref:DUF6475 domain-containing protein n=1 Tax=Acidovorax sp. Root219 TaxID=1736493 RepID=UPI00070B23CC|nr:DUF6475 domain-containing protein [Acidovorax sp. Root219]KRC18077.1 hypothetical protein ASE28_04665 [Acidovorax sp. Root219]
MQPSERAPFAQLVTDVLAYYRQDASRFVLDLWWGACQPFELSQIRQAMQRHATDAEHGRFAPRVADVVRILAGTAADRAALAWGKTLEAMGSVGAYTDVVFDDPAIHATVVDLGGWPKVCRTDLSELGYLQHRFCESHRAYTGRGSFDYPRCLGGDRSPDSEYAKVGLPPPRIAFIGNAERARLVYDGGSAAGKTAVRFHTLQALAAAPRDATHASSAAPRAATPLPSALQRTPQRALASTGASPVQPRPGALRTAPVARRPGYHQGAANPPLNTTAERTYHP